jgi:hypothetical protein
MGLRGLGAPLCRYRGRTWRSCHRRRAPPSNCAACVGVEAAVAGDGAGVRMPLTLASAWRDVERLGGLLGAAEDGEVGQRSWFRPRGRAKLGWGRTTARRSRSAPAAGSKRLCGSSVETPGASDDPERGIDTFDGGRKVGGGRRPRRRQWRPRRRRRPQPDAHLGAGWRCTGEGMIAPAGGGSMNRRLRRAS